MISQAKSRMNRMSTRGFTVLLISAPFPLGTFVRKMGTGQAGFGSMSPKNVLGRSLKSRFS